MSIKTLMIFVTVYKEESITAAANKLNISQPAVSLAIRELENEYSIRLFERAGRGIQKTSAARHLYEFASHITSLYQEMDSEFKKQDQTTPLRIGFSSTIGACLMPDIIHCFTESGQVPMPYIKVDTSDRIETAILENQLDLALTEGVSSSDKMLTEPFAKEQLILVCSPSHPLAQKAKITLEDLKEERFLLREKGSQTRKLAESAFHLHDFILRPVLESTSIEAIIWGAYTNLGIAILPEHQVSGYLEKGTLFALHLQGVELKREYQIIYHQNKYLNPVMLHFMELVKQKTNTPWKEFLPGRISYV
nr:LysR family transcriptional regulator [uncultured Clostridium sp.]